MTSLRPDEYATASEIERARSRDNILKRAAGSALLGAGVGAAHYTGLSAKVLPFLSEYLPIDLAIKGISKVSPELGSFLQKGIKKGLNAQEGLNFIKNNFVQNPAQQSKNIIEQYSPELHKFISDEIQRGRSPLQAGALAQMESSGTKGFKSIIDKIIKDHKAPWSAILQTVYGEGQPNQASQQQAQPQAAPQQQAQQTSGIDPELAKLMQGGNRLIENYLSSVNRG